MTITRELREKLEGQGMRRRLGLIVGLTAASTVATAALTGIAANPASATPATVSSQQINCGTAASSVTLTGALATGDNLSLSYINCNHYKVEWTGFASTSPTKSSGFTENGNNATVLTLNGYSGTTTAGTTLITLTETGVGATRVVTLAQGTPTPQASRADKVTICHRTHATTNPYVLITVAVSSVIDNTGANVGHATHNSDSRHPSSPYGVYNSSYTYPANQKWWGDIIPPFIDNATGNSYAGLNWTGTYPSSTTAPGDANNLWITKTNFFAAYTGSGCTSGAPSLSSTPGAGKKSVQELYDMEVAQGEDPDDVFSDIEPTFYDPEQNLSNPPTTGTRPGSRSGMDNVETTNPTNTGQTSADLNGNLITNNTWTDSKFQYRVKSGNGTTTDSPSLGTDTGSNVPKTWTLTGLTCNTTYEYRIVGTTSSGTYYGGFKTFTTNACPGNSGNGNGGGNGGGHSTPTPSATPSASPSPSTPGHGRPPALVIPPAHNPQPSSTPTPGSTSTPNPSSSPSTPQPPAPTTPRELDPTKTTPPPPGTEWDPTKTRLEDPNTGKPVTEVTTPAGTWTVNPKSGVITFVPSGNYSGTATVRVILQARTGALQFVPMRTGVTASSRILRLAGDVPRDVNGGRLRRRS